MRELWLLDDARVMGGGQHFALRLARSLIRSRGQDSVRILCPQDTALAGRAKAVGVRVEHLPFPPPTAPLALLRSARRLRRLLRGRDPLVVAGAARCQAVAVAAGEDARLVHLMHERDSAARVTVRLLHKRGRVVAVGATASATYGARTIRNFLLDEEFDQLARTARCPHEEVLGVLARLIPEKGVAELVSELRSVGSWSRLLVGGGPQDHAYEARVRQAADERTELLGHVDDVPAFLGRIDVLVVPSVGNEAQPTVIIEALAAGRPVVVREAIQSPDYEGLPVFEYGNLRRAFDRAYAAPAPDAAVVRARFGAAQALDGLEATP